VEMPLKIKAPIRRGEKDGITGLKFLEDESKNNFAGFALSLR